MLEFEFMRRTLMAGLLFAIALPLIGIVMINRKTSMVSDALSHVSLTGVGLGLIFGFDPVIGAVVSCVVAGFSIEAVRSRMPQLGDMAVAVIMSAGLGLAVILADLAPGGNTFESYLFGSISSVTPGDLLMTGVAFLGTVALSVMLYAGLSDIAIDATLARLSGVRVRLVNGAFTALSAVMIGLACKVVGALLVVSLVALPVATALVLCRSYRQTCMASTVLGVVYTMSGLTFSYHFDVRPGGAIVMAAIIGILVALCASFVMRRVRGDEKASSAGLTAAAAALSDE
ncbi:metal ABC transporter permease [Eggerthellaceae bacterium zg-1084]|uniref:Metal ABC transporter permease n=1 Tax=Berryella wangjianweii TaxID=2734634 RepID=A0A6M8J8C2_9ACTN|nr:metal ABC transporter permease [Berryella wangjianweii]NPD30428.1 metal ABC transporter permease [Berryella wangjianweii]NPD32734.1 metal ABC transporter permease [Eggerthellaceae bacterium zg-997]QKF07102.1 metal ABC transporter permease [Berryella wangjianweii]